MGKKHITYVYDTNILALKNIKIARPWVNFIANFSNNRVSQPVIPPTSRMSVTPRGPITERFGCTC